ncbi:MAG TPA: hypothetical protein VJ898_11440 [Natrialbaceae archaeon]|nr:hypothetical protein [Natrialbaceae archaeon]
MAKEAEDRSLSGGTTDPLVGAGSVAVLYDDLSDEADGHYCEQALTVGPAEQRAELLVRFTDEDSLRIGMGDGHNNRQPAKRGVIVVGDGMEARTLAREEPDFDDPVVTDAILDPANLQALGTAISRFCQVWAEEGYHITVCFDSLSDVIAIVDPETAFQFVHVLGKRLEAVDATAHFHVDPDAHDESVLGPFEDALDEVFVEFEADESTLDVSVGSGRASDADVADSLGGDTEGGDRDDGTSTSTDGGSEASDEDIADALGDP